MESEKIPFSSKNHLSISCPMWKRKSGWPPLVHTGVCGLLVPSTVREAAAVFVGKRTESIAPKIWQNA